MAAAVPPRQLEASAIATPIHSLNRFLLRLAAGLWHLAGPRRFSNYLTGTHVETTRFCSQPALVAPAPRPVAARSCRARGNLAAPSQLHGIGPRLAKPGDGDAVGGRPRRAVAAAQCAV